MTEFFLYEVSHISWVSLSSSSANFHPQLTSGSIHNNNSSMHRFSPSMNNNFYHQLSNNNQNNRFFSSTLNEERKEKVSLSLLSEIFPLLFPSVYLQSSSLMSFSPNISHISRSMNELP